jgi:hypothetical protein
MGGPNRNKEGIQAAGVEGDEKTSGASGEAGEAAEQMAQDFVKANDGGALEQSVAQSILAAKEVGGEAKVAVEGPDLFLKPSEITNRLSALQLSLKEVDALAPKERKEFVLNNRRKLIEAKFYVWYARENGMIEDKGGEEVWLVDDQRISLTEYDRSIEDIEGRLSSVTFEGDDGKEKSIYEDLEARRDEITPGDFKRLSISERLELVSNIKSIKELGENALLVFDFGKNRSLEYAVGLGDLMPPAVRAISLGGVEYKRRGNQGFYNEGRYLAIFNGTRVNILTSKADYDIEKEFDEKFEGAFAESDLVAKAGGIDSKVESTEVTYKDLFEVGRDYLVDAYFLQAVTAELQFDDTISTGGNFEFVNMAARYIQNAEAKYEELFGSSLHSSGKYYNEKFIAFAMDRFNLFNGYSPKSEDKIKAVMARYGKLRGVNLNFTDDVKAERDKMNPATNAAFRKRSLDKGFVEGGLTYERPTGGKGIDMLGDLESWKEGLRESLRKKVPQPSEREIEMTVFYSESVYANMRNVMGDYYNSQVTLQSPNGEMWTVKNSCVGGSMSFSAGLPLNVMRGYQAGKRFACNKRWGSKKEQALWRDGFHYIKSLVSRDDLVVEEHGLTPGNVDEKVGRHLAVGETAVAGFWNHALWLYKKPNGTVMMVHSGADVRARRISVSSVDEAPAGYDLRGNYYVRRGGSKVNEIPYREFLARKRSTYSRDRAFVKFVPMSTLVAENLNYSVGQGQFTSYFEQNKGSMNA